MDHLDRCPELLVLDIRLYSQDACDKFLDSSPSQRPLLQDLAVYADGFALSPHPTGQELESTTKLKALLKA